MRNFALLLTCLILAACQSSESPVTAEKPKPVQPVCKAAELQNLIGKDANSVKAIRFGNDTLIRIIEPGFAYTKDFRPTRTQIYIGQNGQVEKVACG